MLENLAKLTLKNGAPAEIFLLEPPETSPFVDGLKTLHMEKSDTSRRWIHTILDGNYTGECVDHFFLAVNNGQVAGSLWYGYGRHKAPIANFGHVFVSPPFRGLGITQILLQHFKRDFSQSPCLAAFCKCSREWIAKMYRNIGFTGVEPGSSTGKLMLLNSDEWGDFRSLEEEYYRRGSPLLVEEGSMQFRHEIDCLGAFTDHFSPRGLSSQWLANYLQALFLQEDGAASLLNWRDDEGHIFGWGVLSTISQEYDWFDYTCHPNVTQDEEADLLQQSTRHFKSGRPVVTSVKDTLPHRKEILTSCGFRECGRLPGETLFRQ